MKKHQTLRSRALALALTLVLVIGMLPMSALAIYHTDYATPATDAALENSSKTFVGSPGGGYLRIVNGELYVWGANTSWVFGIRTYNGKAVDTNTVIETPVKHDFEFDGKLVEVGMSTLAVSAVTDQGSIYYWGNNPPGHYKGANLGNELHYPYRTNTDLMAEMYPNGYEILELQTSNATLAANVQYVDDDGVTHTHWWLTGIYADNYGNVTNTRSGSTAAQLKWYPVAETFMDQMQGSFHNGYTTVKYNKFIKFNSGTNQYEPMSLAEAQAVDPNAEQWMIPGVDEFYTDESDGTAKLVYVTAARGTKTSFEVREPSERYDEESETYGAKRRELDRFVLCTPSSSATMVITDPDATQDASGNWTTTTPYPEQGSCEGRFIYALSGNWMNLMPDAANGKEQSYAGVQNCYAPQNYDLYNAKPQWSTMVSNSSEMYVLDQEYNVWLWGDSRNYGDTAAAAKASNYQGDFLEPGEMIRYPHKIYDVGMTGAKTKKVYLATTLAVILAEDNSLYAVGRNSKQFISESVEDNAVVTTATEVFAGIAKDNTIVGVFPTNLGVMVVTQAGDLYYAGDASKGATADGNLESTVGTEIRTSVPENMDPVKPTSANQIIFEFEYDGHRYRSATVENEDGSVTPQLVEWTESGGQKYWAEVTKAPVFDVANIIKLNVYFNDFAKISQFVVPIRFNPNFVQVVNGAGEYYSTTQNVSPGALGSSVGIVQEFTPSQWSGGELIGYQGSDNHPIISNGAGWVSVAGHTTDNAAKITGEVKMFSIAFRAVSSSGTSLADFAIATDEPDQLTAFNINAPAGMATYDEGLGIDSFHKGAGWLVTNTTASGTAKAGTFDFDYRFVDGDGNEDTMSAFPKFTTKLMNLTGVSVTLQRSDGTTVPDGETVKAGTGEEFTGYGISDTNVSEVYTVVSKIQPDDASYPEVDFDYDLVYPVDTNDTTYMENDFISVLTTTNTTLSFKLPDDYDGGVAVIDFTVTTRKTATDGQKKTASLRLVIMSVESPESVQIMMYDSDSGTYYHPTEAIVYDSILLDPDAAAGKNLFYADFPDNYPTPRYNSKGGQDGYNYYFGDVTVSWKLLDKDRNVLANSPTDAARLGSTTDGAGSPGVFTATAGVTAFTYPRVSLIPQHTTFDGDKLYLRVESTADPTKYDEVEILVHLKATEVYFNRPTTGVYLPTESDPSQVELKQVPVLRMSTDSSYDLSTLVRYAPENDVYETDYVWSWKNLGSGSAIEWQNSSRINSGSSRTTSTKKTVAGTGDQVDAYDYDVVTVTDSISNLSATIYIQVLELESPIKADQVEVFNLVGDMSDYIEVSGLKIGDKIEFYTNYDDGTPKYTRGPMTAGQLGITDPDATATFQFPTPGPNFLNGTGGEIAYRVYRVDSSIDTSQMTPEQIEAAYWSDKIPVSYNAEPSKVYGYVRLAGKDNNSARNAGITVELIGRSTPKPVETDANGYFEFTSYIIPGNYTLRASQGNYLTRVIQPDDTGFQGITISAAEEFAISTDSDPILLYPGDLDSDGYIKANDVTSYVRSWVGSTTKTRTPSALAPYDFYDGDSQIGISLYDLELVTRHYGWGSSSYPKWYTPNTK